jgi:hypothetical protein
MRAKTIVRVPNHRIRATLAAGKNKPFSTKILGGKLYSRRGAKSL